MYATKHLDWLSVTIPQDHDFKAIMPLIEWRYLSPGLHGYRSRYTDPKSGAFLDTDSQNAEMGHHFTFSGDALGYIRAQLGGRDDSLCNHLLSFKAKSSRIDLTINLHDAVLTPAVLRDAIENGTAKAKTRRSRYITGRDGDVVGDTYYIGSPTSDRQLRCYDKAAELKIADHAAWIRLELECRRLVANGAFHSTAENGIEATVNGHFVDFLNWQDAEYQAAITGPGVEPEDIPRRRSDRQRWLLGQVATALAKEVHIDPDFGTLFLSQFGKELRKLGET